MTNTYIRLSALFALLTLVTHLTSCSKSTEISVGAAKQHVLFLSETASKDVEELRKGMPEGATHLTVLYQGKSAPKDDLPNVRSELDRARNRVQDLRVAKSTFFCMVDRDGTIYRNDREPDLMSGKNLFSFYPILKGALEGHPVEGRGSMPEATAVKGRADAQYVMAVPVTVDGEVKGVYATGWSWTAYAYRLENALRSEIRGKLTNAQEKEPLIYVFVVVADAVYGAPVSPVVSAEAIRKIAPLTKAQGDTIFSTPIEITGREFGLAVKRAPSLGTDVALAVLRSET
jgi:hypothetical protein